MRYLSVGQFLPFLEQRAREVEVALGRAHELRSEYLQIRQAVQLALARAERAVPQALIPDLREDLLQPLAGVLSFPWLRSGLVGAMNAQRQAIQDRLAAIEADEAWTNRVELRDPEHGTMAPRILELQRHCEALQPVLDRFRHPRLQALLDNGYGTDDYATPFWRTSYYADRSAADEILAQCGSGKSFKEAREEYLQTTAALAALRQSLEGLRTEWDRGVALEKEHAELTERLRTLRESSLEEARGRTSAFMRENPRLLERLEPLPAVAPHARRLAGLVHKLIYLDGLTTARLDPLITQLLAERQALQQEMAFLRTPQHARDAFAESQVKERFHGRHEETMRHLDQYLAVLHALAAFEDYDRGRLTPPFLWWDLMTDGRWKGDYIPQVRDFRLCNPQWAWQPSEQTSPGHPSDTAAAPQD